MVMEEVVAFVVVNECDAWWMVGVVRNAMGSRLCSVFVFDSLQFARLFRGCFALFRKLIRGQIAANSR